MSVLTVKSLAICCVAGVLSAGALMSVPSVKAEGATEAAFVLDADVCRETASEHLLVMVTADVAQDGKDGDDGRGDDGKDGKDGDDGRGSDGQDGKDGEDGRGADGKDGKSP